MIESTTYLDSVAAGELVPQITMARLNKTEEEWTFQELGEIFQKMQNMFAGDLSHNAVRN